MPHKISNSRVTPSLRTLGEAIQRARESQKLTLAESARRSQVSIGMLSQVERGQVNPSFVTMTKVAKGLGVPLTHFLDGQGRPVKRRVVGPRERKLLAFPEIGLSYQLLTPDLSGQLELLLIEVAPGLSTKSRPFRHAGEEAGLLLRGTLEVHLGDQVETMNAGDSIAYSSDTPHWYRNPGRRKVLAVWAITPPSF